MISAYRDVYHDDCDRRHFPWPQSPTRGQIAEVAAAAVALRALRREVMAAHGWSLRALYRTLDEPGDNPLRTAQARLDTAVRAAYGMPAKADTLAFLLKSNLACAAKEKAGEKIIAPGLPLPPDKHAAFITDDGVAVATPQIRRDRSDLMNPFVSGSKREFIRRVRDKWLPAYCNDAKHKYSVEGFSLGNDTLGEQDAHDFLRALDCNVASIGKRQRLRMARGMTSETLFWEGLKSVQPRPLSLWLESVITVAVGARLHLDYGWPVECLGMQSKDYAFDLMAFRAPDFENEDIAVEVKKTAREVDELLRNLAKCCAGEHEPSCENGERKNAHRKWIALQERQPRLFWAVGPSPTSRVFEVVVAREASIRLQEVSPAALRFEGETASLPIEKHEGS
ncbi:MAG: hypothetical protein ABI946_00670 [Chthoniobacterales bacterium]